jgi:hypothetical protein
MNKIEIPLNQKLCLSIEEAAQYSMLGENRIRKLIEDDKSLDWVLHVGSWIRIKRPQFETWVLKQNNL